MSIYTMPDMSYAPINPQTGRKYTARRQVGFGVNWYDEPTQPQAPQAPARIEPTTTPSYTPPTLNLPAPVSGGDYQPSPLNLPPQVTGGGDNPFMGQMNKAQSSMDAYLGQSGPSLNNQNAFADPLAASQKRLSSLMDDPNSIQQSAAYKFRVGQGQEALQRQQAAKGMLGSGNRLMELTKYGQDMGSQEYDAQAQRLQQQLGLQSQGYGNERQANLGQYQAELGAHTARGSTLANLLGTATGAASSAYGSGLQAATSQRGQDISALTTGRGQDIGWQEAQMQNATTGRGQDLSALVQGRGQDIGWQEAMMNAGLTGRGQDVTQRGQDLSYQAAMSKLQDSQNTGGGNVTTRGGFSTRGY